MFPCFHFGKGGETKNERIQRQNECLRRWTLYGILFVLAVGVALITLTLVKIADCLPTWRWGIAMFYAILVGHYTGSIFISALRDCYIKLPPSPHEPKDFRLIPPGFMGFFERLIFTILVGIFANDLGPIFATMGVWLLLKLISGWNRAPVSIKNFGERKAFREFHRLGRSATAALLAGIVNLAFAMIAGLMASGRLNWPEIRTFLSGFGG